MATEFTRYLFNNLAFNEDEDIADTVTDGSTMRGSAYIVGGLTELEAWAFDSSCSCPQYNPNQTTPPLPNVYPILFSSDVVYGREHFESNLKMFRGDSYQRNFLTIQDGEYYNLTNCDIRMTFKWSLEDSDSDAVFVKTLDNNGISIISYSTGEFRLIIDPEDTNNLPSTTVELFFDAQITDVNGNVFTVAYGKLIIVSDVSITVP